VLNHLGISNPDYIVSGIPFTIMERDLRERLLASIANSMGPESVFITYQFSMQISEHELFELLRCDLCVLNFPPLRVMELRKSRHSIAHQHP
jgi:phospholipid N-methyltransferase